MNKTPQTALKTIATQFGVQDSNTKITMLGNGLINATYLVTSDSLNFVLQKINQNVFPQPLDVIDNAELINQHLIDANHQENYQLTPISQLPTIDGKKYVEHNNEYWRALSLIEDCYTIEAVETTQQAELAAASFAHFSSALSDFQAEKLVEIIPKFHDLGNRIEQLQTAISSQSSAISAEEKQARLLRAEPQLALCFEQQAFIDEVVNLSSSLPLHVTHNDTKINNLLFSKQSQKPIAVIDLDTCMPGFLMNDFGDMVRTCCSNIAEDATNLDEMEIRLDIFRALANAYINGFGDRMLAVERHSLLVGVLLFPFMLGVRFLTDYFNGDVYFHTNHETHNLERAMNQFNLFSLLQKNKATLQRIIDEAGH